MSQENVEIVRQIYDAVACRDSATVLSLYDPEVEIDNTRAPSQAIMGGKGIHRGHEGLKAFFGGWYEAWDDVEADVAEFIDTGDHVISVLTYRARGRASGVAVEIPVAGLWTIRDGKVVRVAWLTRAEALEAAGLSE